MIEPPIEAKVIRIQPLTWHDAISVRFDIIGCGEPSTTTYTPFVTSVSSIVSTVSSIVTMKQMIEPPIEAKVIRIQPLTWHDAISIRFDIIGCGEPSTTTYIPFVTTPEPLQCTEPLGLAAELPIESIEVSSNNDLRKYFRLDGERGWRPAYSTPGEWIMFDFTAPRNITGIKTKGGPTGWVTSYNILYTSDLSTFNPVVDNTGSYKIFPANFDKSSEVFNEFRPPIHARYLKVLPLRWKNGIEMRIEPIGCFEPYLIIQSDSYKIFPANFDKSSVVFNEFRRYLKVKPQRWKNGIEMRIEPIGCFEPYLRPRWPSIKNPAQFAFKRTTKPLFTRFHYRTRTGNSSLAAIAHAKNKDFSRTPLLATATRFTVQYANQRTSPA
ncbi:f5/8 type C domain-containing protein [Phthorimaea operculella]|nr:f5/8 type C domain-containing protein [Phthorimaea operculella]